MSTHCPARYSVAHQKSFELASQSGGTAVLTRRYIAVVGVNAEFDWSYSGVNPDIGWSYPGHWVELSWSLMRNSGVKPGGGVIPGVSLVRIAYKLRNFDTPL